jgi:hypothetical protein
MAITTYAELQTSVINFTHRADLASILPDLVRLAEDAIFGDLEVRNQDTVTTLVTVADTPTVALPSDFIKMRSLSLSSVEPGNPLQYLTPELFVERFQFDESGEPSAYTIIGQNIHLAKTPDDAYSLRTVYEVRLVNLSDSQTTNWLLTNFPAVYLYATLVQAGIYIKKDVSTWLEAYTQIINKLNMKDWNEAGQLRVRHDFDLTSPYR